MTARHDLHLRQHVAEMLRVPSLPTTGHPHRPVRHLERGSRQLLVSQCFPRSAHNFEIDPGTSACQFAIDLVGLEEFAGPGPELIQRCLGPIVALLGSVAEPHHPLGRMPDVITCFLRGLGRDQRTLQRALVGLGARHADVIIPGYTHLQRAQPVYFAHHLLAYVEMLDRDRRRLIDCFQRVNVCPLGSGAIAGSTLPLDRELVATLLGFVDAQGKPQLTQNSMDAVSDRDFAVEFCGVAALLAVHLSRLAEDLILWASAEFNFIKIAD